MIFTHGLCINSDKLKQKSRISTLYISKLLHTGCSTKEAITLLPSTWNFKKKLLLQIHFGWSVANENKAIRIKTLYILEILYTGCSSKEAVLLLILWSTLCTYSIFKMSIVLILVVLFRFVTNDAKCIYKRHLFLKL